MADKTEDRSLRSTRGYPLRTLRVRGRRSLCGSKLHCSLSDPAPDPEGITAYSRSVEDLRDDTTGSLF